MGFLGWSEVVPAIHRNIVSRCGESPPDFLVISLDAAIFPGHAAAPNESDADGSIGRFHRLDRFR